MDVFIATNRIDGVMASVLASSAVDREYEPRPGQTKDYKTGICRFSAISTQHYRVRAKTCWLRIRIMCPSGAPCLPEDCCFM